MKVLKIVFSALFATACFSAAAQDFSDPRYAKWGETPEQRKDNILASQFLKEEIANRHYNEAARYLQQLIASCPAASENTFANGVTLYKQKINRAQSIAEKKVYVDSLLWLYDVRMQYFASHPKRGKVYLLERKAREYQTYKESDREGIRKAFETAILAQNEATGTADPEVVAIYFKNLCDDYTNDIVDAMTVVNAYDANAKYFENLPEDKKEFKDQFEACFAKSGAASCDNIEKIFSKKLAATPDDETTLYQAVTLLSRANCDSDFFFNVAEKYYAIHPTSEIAMFLAQGFQNKQNFDKAIKYLNEGLATETVPAEREKLYVRLGILSMSKNDYPKAIEAFRAAGEINAENGYVPYFLAQCYVVGACGEGITRSAIYWLTFDMLQRAIPLLEKEDADTANNARTLAGRYRSAFPSKEDCFFNELKEGSGYTIKCGYAAGQHTTVRYR